MKKLNIIYLLTFLFLLSCKNVLENVLKNECNDLIYKSKKVDNKDRYNDLSNQLEKKINRLDKTGVFITYGQSNSINASELGYNVKNNVLMFYDNKTYRYNDPSLGGALNSGKNGSVWGMVGDKLINNNSFEEVVFSMNGWGSTTIKDLSQDSLYNYFKNNYYKLLTKFDKVDGILFHQGESNHFHKQGNNCYYENFNFFYNKLKLDNINSKFYLSMTSYCGKVYSIDTELLKIQDKIIKENKNIFRGPNTDLLIDDIYRLDDECHFSLLGLDKFSDMWVISINNKSQD